MSFYDNSNIEQIIYNEWDTSELILGLVLTTHVDIIKVKLIQLRIAIRAIA